MTNYKLEEFKTWLAEKPTRQKNLTLWEDYFKLIVDHDGTIDEFFFLAFGTNEEGKEIENSKTQTDYQKILNEWVSERERERESRKTRSLLRAFGTERTERRK